MNKEVKFVIPICRQFGTGVQEIGVELARRLLDATNYDISLDHRCVGIVVSTNRTLLWDFPSFLCDF